MNDQRTEPDWRRHGVSRAAIVKALREAGRPMRTGELAAAIGANPQTGSFKRLLRSMFEAGELDWPAHGLWALPERS